MTFMNFRWETLHLAVVPITPFWTSGIATKCPAYGKEDILKE